MFGFINNNDMIVNDAGKMIQSIWDEIPFHYNGIKIDTFQIMPDHIHGIIHIMGQPQGVAPSKSLYNTTQGQAPVPAPGYKQLSLPDIVHRFKTMTTTRYIYGIKHYRWPSFNKKLWQRNYHERVIYNQISLIKIREYIINNTKHNN